MTALPDVLPSAQAQVFSALVRRCSRGPVTLRQLSVDTGLAVSTVHLAVKALDAEGLVAFEPGQQCTLRPTVAIGTPEQARESIERGFDRGYDGTREPEALRTPPAPSTSTPSHERHDGQ